MPIEVQCACGKLLRAPDSAAGKQGKCTKCGATVTVPMPGVTSINEYDLAPVAKAPRPRTVSAQPPPQPRMRMPEPPLMAPPVGTLAGGLRRFVYLVLLLGLIPLILHTWQESHKPALPEGEDEFTHRLALTIDKHQEDKNLGDKVVGEIERIKNGDDTLDDLFNVLPDHKLEGALLSRDTTGHWSMAAAAAVASLVLLLAMFPGALKRLLRLFLTGLFTGTVGILLLLGFQYAASFSGGMGWHLGGGRAAIIFLILKLIGLSYSLTDDPNAGFFLSAIGFTCGVGLCEEVTKAIPLLFRVKDVPGQEDARWNDLLLIGLASGFGFGIAEGIMYSHRYYNGIEPGSIYVVRFVSCVVLHAIWAGAVGVTIYNRKEWLRTDNWWAYWGSVVLIVLVPMTLHGAYDTLLKMQYNAWALAIAVASFGWLAIQIERMHHQEPTLA